MGKAMTMESERKNIIEELCMFDDVQCCQFAEGEHLLVQDEPINYVYYLQEGLCCQYILQETGEEHILYVQGGDDTGWSLLGVIYLFANGVSGMNYEALSDCICYRIPIHTMFYYLERHSKLLMDLLRQSMSLYNNLYEHLQYRWQGNTVGQLCQFLLDHAEEKNGTLLVKKFYTNIRISQFLGIHNITASRIIKSLKDEGAIKRDKKGIIILHEDALSQYISGGKKLNYYK